jgi:hypothetical protein
MPVRGGRAAHNPTCPENPSLLDDAARLKGTSDIARPVWPVATLAGELTARRLVITFVPTPVADAEMGRRGRRNEALSSPGSA